MIRITSKSMPSFRATITATLLALVGAGAAAVPASAATSESIVWTFGHANREPTSGLVADGSGNLYGEASSGSGVVYELSPPSPPGGSWTHTQVARFFGGYYGCSPSEGLILDGVGNLYGTAGCGLANGGGIVFKLTRPSQPGSAWTESVLYAFKPDHNAEGDASNPRGRLVFDTRGNLYGVTVTGGRYGYGTIYRLSPPARGHGQWTETLLYQFKGGLYSGRPGYSPDHGLTFDATGNLYGTTTSGGSVKGPCGGNCGTAFKLTPQGSEWGYEVVHYFTGADGYDPESELTLDGAGNLFGVATYGGVSGSGVAFELSPPTRGHAWKETALYQFPQFAGDSAYPYASLVLDGHGGVYGTSQVGGPTFEGTVFHLTPPSNGTGAWAETVIHSFTGGNDGAYPVGSLIYNADGRLYGATEYGGAGECIGEGKYRGCGTVFGISP
jgi:uncharacterized repeat protein (TIGR03803 family)